MHFRVQRIERNSGDPEIVDFERDKVLNESRGSSVIERYVDPNDPQLPDFAQETVDERVEDYYRFRILERREFTP